MGGGGGVGADDFIACLADGLLQLFFFFYDHFSLLNHTNPPTHTHSCA